jgi:hypothetical protein
MGLHLSAACMEVEPVKRLKRGCMRMQRKRGTTTKDKWEKKRMSSSSTRRRRRRRRSRSRRRSPVMREWKRNAADAAATHAF